MKNSENKGASTLEVEVKIQTRDKAKAELREVFVANAKVTKTENVESRELTRDRLELKIDGFRADDGFTYPSVQAVAGSKLTKADSGLV